MLGSAWQRLIARKDFAGGFSMHFLGFVARGFPVMDAARKAATDFARRVLSRMGDMIAD
jgi:hypothetical protein